MTTANPFHAGELEAQRRAGETAIGQRTGAALTRPLEAKALPFLNERSFIVLSTVARTPEGLRPRASWLSGPSGFLRGELPSEATVPEGRGRLQVGIQSATGTEPWLQDLQSDSRIGALAIDLSQRKRMRLNGTASHHGDHLTLQLDEAYGNCPKFIHRWENDGAPPTKGTASVEEQGEEALSANAQRIVAQAETLFVASQAPGGSLDASHRGGPAGFVRYEAGRIHVPDYSGNGMHNTLGNFLAAPYAGLLVPDFERGLALQLQGEVALHWDEADDLPFETDGTGRWWSLKPERFTVRALGHPEGFVRGDASPFSPSRI